MTTEANMAGGAPVVGITEGDVAKAAPVAIAAAAGACSVVPGIGTGICAAGAAIASALVAFGTWIAGLGRDTFHPDKATAEALLMLFRIHPAAAFLTDVDRAADPQAAAKLARYFRVVSGEVPAGQRGNNGILHNPYLDPGDYQNPYQGRTDPAEPLTSIAYYSGVFNNYQKWVASGGGSLHPTKGRGNLAALPRFVPTPHRRPEEARMILDAIRRWPAPFIKVLQAWGQFGGIADQMQEQVREMRRLAGEDGPDPGGKLQAVFGGDLTVHAPHRPPFHPPAPPMPPAGPPGAPPGPPGSPTTLPSLPGGAGPLQAPGVVGADIPLPDRVRAAIYVLDRQIRSRPALIQAGFPVVEWLNFVRVSDPLLRAGDVQEALRRWDTLHRFFLVERFLSQRLPAEAPTVGSWEGFLATPGSTLDYMNRVGGAIDALNSSIQGDAKWATAPGDFVFGWTKFHTDWHAFYDKNKDWLSRTWASTWDDTAAYEKQLATWRSTWEGLGGRPNVPPLAPAEHMPSAPSLPDSGKTVGIGVMLAAGAVLLLAMKR